MRRPTPDFRYLLAALLAAVLGVSSGAAPLQAEPSGAWKAWLGGSKLAESKALFQREWEEGPRSAETALGLAQTLLLSGDRERAFAAALEGLQADPSSPFAFALLDMIGEDAALNILTVKLAQEGLNGLLARTDLDPYLRFRVRWVLLRLAPRSGDGEAVRRMRAACGFLPGAFFTPVVERLTRLEFRESRASENGGPLVPNAYFSELEGAQVRPPAYLMGEGGEAVFTATVPFGVETGTEALLYFNSSRPFRVSLDGKVLLERDVFADQANPTTLWKVYLSKGFHRLGIKLHASVSHDGLNIAALDTKGEPLAMTLVREPAAAAGPTAPSRSLGEVTGPFPGTIPATDPRRVALDALYLRWQGDVASARLAMEEFALANPGQFLWNLWATRLYLFEAEDLPEKIAQSRAERALNNALASEPGCPMARYYKALLTETQSQSDEDMLALKALAQEFPTDPRWGLRLVSRMSEKGWRHEARAALEGLSIQHPDCPQVLWSWVGFYAQVPDRQDQRQAIARLEKTGTVLEAWENYYAAMGDWRALKANLTAQASLYGDRDMGFAKKIADVAYRAGNFEEARAGYAKLSLADPTDPGSALTAARCAFLMGDREGGMRLLDEIKERKPDAFQVDLARWAMGETLPFQDQHLPLSRVMEEDRTNGPEEAPSSLILDQQFGKVQKDGSSVERYHGVIRINSKEGVDKEGEQVLQGQVVLAARTVKKDGTILEPEQIPEKRTLSMPGLEPGDLVEVEYITLRPPNRIREGTYLTSNVFLFQDIDRPFHRTQWWIEYPAALPMVFAEQNLPKPGERLDRGATKVANWDYRSMPRITPEPDTPARQLYIPLVEAVGGISWKDIALFLKDGILGSFQKTPELRAAYRKAVAGAGAAPEDKLQAIIDYAMREIEGEQDGSWDDPTQALLNRSGNRIPVVAALLDMAGIRWEILLTEPVPERTFRDDLPRLGTYQVPILRVHLKGGPRDLVLSSPRRSTTPLPWYLQGARALPVLAADPSAVVSLGTNFSVWRQAAETETRTLLPSGDMKLEHAQTFDPDGGPMLRSNLNQIAKDQREQVLQMALSRQLGSVELESFDLQNMDDPTKPFGWSYTLLVRGFAVSDGDKLVVAEPIPALHLSQALASLKERKLPLASQGVTFMSQKFTVVLPEGFDTDYKPRSVELKTPYGSYKLDVRREGATFTFDRSFELPYQVVPPEKYAEFAKFLEEADRAEAGQMILAPKKQ
jgi:tetratricopeptide (TPR) repeat protein